VSDHLAKEADRLKNDELFNTALDAIRSEALNALAIADADDITVMLRLQQRVAVIDEIRATLDRYIIASEPAEDTGSYA
jgi:hypothetical protein